ncbi:hypothetical protein H8356DRAFT_1649466 [Neocallimastix lanati (nom. inval.)]|nr:hypothetical protein H8356DRAFT_1649466 [Neocallimastix sp. JGI-2020a]
MGEPIKKLGQIVSDIQDTLGQFNNNISKSDDIENYSEKNEKNIAIIDKNNIDIKNEIITEFDDHEKNYAPESNILTEDIFEKINDEEISLTTFEERKHLNSNIIDIHRSGSIKKYDYQDDINENIQRTQSLNSEKYNFYDKEENDSIYNIESKNSKSVIKDYPLVLTNSTLNSEVFDKDSKNKKYTKEHSYNMKLNIPDENTYLLMKDLIEKTKQKSEDILNLNNIINEYSNKNKIIEEENKNLRKINKEMQFKLDEVNANLLNMTSFDNKSNIKENEVYINDFSLSSQENLITLLDDIISSFTDQLNNDDVKSNNNSYITKLSIEKLIKNFNECLGSIKLHIKNYSKEKPYTLSYSLITDVCNCFKNCHNEINELYLNNKNLNEIKIEDNDIDVLKEKYKKSLYTLNKLENENKKNILIINKLNSEINNNKTYNLEKNKDLELNDLKEKYNQILIENNNMKKNQSYLENLIEKWKQENDKLQKAILTFKNDFHIDKDLLLKNRILKNKLDDERLNIKKYNELIKALKLEIDQLKKENIQDNGKLTKKVSSELSNIKDIQSLYLESIKQITNKYNDNETSNSGIKILNKQIEKLYEAVQESDKTRSHLTQLEQTIEEQVKEKEKIVSENKKIKKDYDELQEKYKTHEDIWLKKCRDLNIDLNNTKNILKKTHTDYMNKEKELIECQTIIDDYLLQYSKACDTCIAISSVHKKSTQFLDNLYLKPGLSKQPFPFDEEIKHLCSWIKENENELKNKELNTEKLNELLNNKNKEINLLKNKSDELKLSLTDLQNLYDESKKKEKLTQELNEKQKKEYEEKLSQSLEKQKILKKKIDHLFKGCQLFVSGAPASAYSLN